MNAGRFSRRAASVLSLGVLFGLAIGNAGAQNAPPAPDPAAAAARMAAIRTPAAPDTPRINGARVFGVHPGKPFLFHIAATGQRPITFTAAGLPTGLSIDAATGIISGRISEAGSHPVTLTATNSLGQSASTLTIVVGDTVCLTPPMGWNSWNFFAGKITGDLTKSAADSMVKTGLIDHGWTYINIDDTWEAKRDAAGKILANEKFPDMKGLSDYIHAQGLKFGIYSSPGPQTCAHYEATYGHEDQDAQSYADWGVDYVKYDWCSYSTIAAKLTTDRYAAAMSPEDAARYNADLARRATIPPPPRGRRGGAGAAPAGQAARGGPTTQQIAEYQQLSMEITSLVAKIDPAKKKQIDLLILQEPYALFRKSLDKVDRDIVYSLCQYGDGNVWTWGGDVGGNLWRTTGDIRANWQSMTNIGFAQNDHAKYASPGHWNDPDMLEVGNGTLTPDENYTHMTLWCMLSAPLLIGCDMPHMDAFTVSLFTNDEVLAVDQDALGHQGSRAKQDGLLEVWTKPLADGTMAVALFNRTDASATVSATWADLKLTGPAAVRDLWRQKNLDGQTDGVSATVASHGAELFRVGSPRS